MKIALIGYGKMGQLVEKIAIQRGHTIVSRISQKSPLSKEAIKDSQICIDFSHPEAVLKNVQHVADAGKNLILGTTGWHEHMDSIKTIVSKHQIGFLFSANFSIGVNLFLAIVNEAARLMNEFPDYDVGMVELHHNKKADSPSGTALAIAQKLLANIQRKKHIRKDTPEARIPPDALHISSLRCGSIPGTHSVIFDSPADTITLTHEARSREGFALGAVAAAEWLGGKKGFFTIEDMFRG